MNYKVQKSNIKLDVLFLMYEMHHSMQIAAHTVEPIYFKHWCCIRIETVQ